MSGHYSTLLRGTVEHFIGDHDVYITDWINARNVPVSDGGFSFDDYVSYIIEFSQFLGNDFHIVAVCQPSVPAIVAVSVMAQRQVSYQPNSLTLLGGPVDTRVNPTEVNNYAVNKELQWFENNVICTVPDNFVGVGQQVYPGFIQLGGFMSMNLDSHINKHFTFFGDLVKGDGDSAESHRQFYNEYLAVMDMPAQFYIDTIHRVFIEHQLPKGEITYLGEPVDCSVVSQVALMTVEGEHDDITGSGQTQAAHDILSGIPQDKKHHYIQSDVGHYGIFNGRRFRQEVGPRIKQFIIDNS
jgi:poly(3-hydroxybutyrate) depolymerase